jgi:hypothetical protein
LNSHEPQRAGGVSYPVFLGLIAIMIIAVIFASIVAYNAGYSSGKSDYIHNNCTSYPFVLLPSNQYWACRIPADMLPGGSQ